MPDLFDNDYKQWNVQVHEWSAVDVFAQNSEIALGIHRIHLGEGPSLDVLVQGDICSTDWKRLPVFFNGAIAQREDKNGPFFSGRGLAASEGYGFIAISDPSTVLGKSLGLAWYAGNQFSQLQDAIVQILTTIHKTIGKDLLFIGGSGGGFAAVLYASLLGEVASAIAWNPQSDILEYNEVDVRNYFQIAFPESARRILEAEDWKTPMKVALESHRVRHELLTLPSRPQNMIVFQNYSDWHVQSHAVPFIKAWSLRDLGDSIYGDTDGRYVYIANFGEGHVSLPSKPLQVAIQMLGKEGRNASTAISQLSSHPELNKGEPEKLPRDLRDSIEALNEEFDLEISYVSESTISVRVQHKSHIHNFGGISYGFFRLDAAGVRTSEAFSRGWARKFQITPSDKKIGVLIRDGFGNVVAEALREIPPIVR